MYKNLNPESLGISGRQNELIELTLTYKFRGFDVDIEDLVKQVEARGRDHALRFLQSADVKIGSFELPIDLAAADETFEPQFVRLETIAELAASVGAKRCIATLKPFCDDRAYHENFELHRKRISRVAEVLAKHGIRLGLGFLAPKDLQEQGESGFITRPDALLTLIQMIDDPNVGLCLDTWHWAVSGGSIEQLQNFPAEKIVMVRLADLPADAKLDEVTLEQRLLPGATSVVPNQEWLSRLDEMGYDGPVTPYCHPAQFSGGTRTQAVEQSAEALTNLLQSRSEAVGQATA